MIGEDGTKTVEYSIDGMHCERCVSDVGSALSSLDGIDIFDVSVGHARISYLPQLISVDEIANAIESSGYNINIENKRKSRWDLFIAKMIKSNEKTFGSGKLDCCTIISDQEKRDQMKRTI